MRLDSYLRYDLCTVRLAYTRLPTYDERKYVRICRDYYTYVHVLVHTYINSDALYDNSAASWATVWKWPNA